LVLAYPASTAASDGAYNLQTDSTVVPQIDACPITHDWAADPAGRPQETTLAWACDRDLVNGHQATVAGKPVWTFDLTPIADDWTTGGLANLGVALIPSASSLGNWSIPLIGVSAKAEARLVTEGTAVTPPAGDRVNEGGAGTITTPAGQGLQGSVSLPPPAPADSGIGPVPAAAAAPVLAPPVAAALPATPIGATGIGFDRTVPPAVWAGLAVLAGLLALVGLGLRRQIAAPRPLQAETI
jgi:hypothetical protein